MEIVITVKDDLGETIVKRTAFTFENAGENLGKLERYFGKHYERLQEQYDI